MKARKQLVMYDDNREPVGPGDKIRFCYGIPGVIVVADVVERDAKLIALTPGHTPPECNLRSLRKYVGMWFKKNTDYPTGDGIIGG